METIGVLIEFKAGRIKEMNFGMVTLLRRSGNPICALLINESAEAASLILARYGVELIVSITVGRHGDPRNPDLWARAVAAALKRFKITQLAGLTSNQGRDLMARIASLLDAPLVMDCTEVDLNRKIVKTTQYSGKVRATIQMSGSYFLYGLRANVVQALEAPTEAQIVEFKYAAEGDGGFEILESRSPGSESQNLAEADVVFSGGRGMKSAENFRLLFDCAGLIPGAAVGASRVAVDFGWVPYHMQVGQTGLKVNPRVYVACGISGSVQHFAGMKNADIIIAINTDPNAAIMAKCDYYAVADLFDVLLELKKQLIEQTKHGWISSACTSAQET